MAGGDAEQRVLGQGGGEELAAQASAGGFDVGAGCGRVGAMYGEGDVERAAELADELFVGIGFGGAEKVVEVEGVEAVAEAVEDVEESDRVAAAGEGHADGAERGAGRGEHAITSDGSADLLDRVHEHMGTRMKMDQQAGKAEGKSMDVSVMERARRLELMLVDIDGVLTDGRIYFVPTATGEWDETKGFSALDGIALQWFHWYGITMGLISGRKSVATEMRAKSGHFKYCYMGNHEKIATLEEIIADAKVPRENIGYMGDDLTDIVCFHRVGFAVAVANARPEVKREAHYVTEARGGDGAFREVAELVLQAKGKWGEILKKYEVG